MPQPAPPLVGDLDMEDTSRVKDDLREKL